MAERLTIIDFVEKYTAQFAKNPFLWEKNLDTNEWEPTTYEDTLKKAKRIAAGLMALGVQKGEKALGVTKRDNILTFIGNPSKRDLKF